MEFLDPEQVLDQIHLESDMIGADFGCGSGGFTIPLAERLDEGLVHAIDIQDEPISALKGQAASQGIRNIKFIRSDLEKEKGSTIQDSFLDVVIISNTLFQAENRSGIIAEADRVMRRGAKLVIVDWIPGSLGSDKKERVSVEQIKRITSKFRLKLEKEFKAGKYHYGLIFKK
tara:strand:+ start:24 stop:542 length:519 start_codon:yes stop_codon:yes gene_type:complete